MSDEYDVYDHQFETENDENFYTGTRDDPVVDTRPTEVQFRTFLLHFTIRQNLIIMKISIKLEFMI